ncbi:MAG: ankyrin repeat domain-containing protein, partial [Methylophilaceae bacterium]|nr:ankyrin repeat domain-containing protein [Methylophilaceae bacterium]
MKKIHLILVMCLSLISLPCMADDIPYLLTMSSKGDVTIVNGLLESGVNPNTVDSDGISALMY